MKYHILVNTDTHNQPVITDRLMAEVNVGIVFGGNYTVSVMAKADGTQRSEPHSESITAGGYKKDTSACAHTHVCAQHMSVHNTHMTHEHLHNGCNHIVDNCSVHAV